MQHKNTGIPENVPRINNLVKQIYTNCLNTHIFLLFVFVHKDKLIEKE